jgi:hypothetical protein
MSTLSAHQSISAEREQKWGESAGVFADKLLGGQKLWPKIRQAYKPGHVCVFPLTSACSRVKYSA